MSMSCNIPGFKRATELEGACSGTPHATANVLKYIFSPLVQ